jgi:murein L,D-transpeptidase YafK
VRLPIARAGAAAATLAAGVFLLSGWDYLQLDRKPPTMAAPSARVTEIVVDKKARTLTLWHDATVMKTYKVSLGRAPIGPKQQEGDGRTPEGRYVIDSKNPRSHDYLALHVSYPDPSDRARAHELGVSPGGDIMIHGLHNGLGWLGSLHRLLDWTDGCVAMTNAEMDEIWPAVEVGTPIEIKP